MNREESFSTASKNPYAPPYLKRVESFIIKEDSPKERCQHQDRAIREAVTPAMLLISASGKEVLVSVEN